MLYSIISGGFIPQNNDVLKNAPLSYKGEATLHLSTLVYTLRPPNAKDATRTPITRPRKIIVPTRPIKLV